MDDEAPLTPRMPESVAPKSLSPLQLRIAALKAPPEPSPPPTQRVVLPEERSTASEAREPYERQPGEGEREWEAFKYYRDLPVPRNVARSGYLGGIRVGSAELSHWYRHWRWAERCEAYDVLTDRIIQAQRKKTLERAVEDATADQLATLARLDEVLSREIEKLLEASRAGNGPGLIKMSDLKGLLEASVKLRRLLTDQTTDKVGVEASTDLSDLSVEELTAWRERLNRPAQGK